MSAQGGVHLPLWTEFLTHTCENITFPQLCLRTVTTNPHLSVVSQTFVMGGVNLREIGVISVTVMNFPQEFETNICVNKILPASTVKRETLIHFFCQVLKFKAVKFRLTECIPIGWVPPAAEAVCWGGGLPQCMLGYTPVRCGPGDPPFQTLKFPLGLGLETPPPKARPLNFPPWVWALRPPRPDPSTSPQGVGLETCMACWDTTPPPRTDRHV